MTRKREKLEIIRDILSTINKSRLIKPTKLLSSSNLSPQMFKEYVNMLLQKNFVNEEFIKGKRSFSLTKKGKEFLLEYRVIENLIENFGL